MNKNGKMLAYGAVLLAMLISSGNFLFGNLAVKEVPAWTLTFWRCLIAALCVLPFVLKAPSSPIQYFRRDWRRVLTLSVIGVVAAPGFIYLALRSNELIDLSAGYTCIPLLTVLFSALLLRERLRPVQYMGVAMALAGALTFAFHGSLSDLVNFKPHVAFLWMIACAASRGLYLVLLKKWDLHPKPDEGLFVLLVLGVLILLPVFINYEVNAPQPFNYSWQVWGSILYVGVGMGAIYLHLLTYGTGEIGASHVSLFAYLVPVLVAAESVAVLGSELHIYQGVGAVLIIGGVLIVTRLQRQTPLPDHPPH